MNAVWDDCLILYIMLPERDQLIRNLFISAESKDYDDNLRRHKLVSPDFIRIIL